MPVNYEVIKTVELIQNIYSKIVFNWLVISKNCQNNRNSQVIDENNHQ